MFEASGRVEHPAGRGRSWCRAMILHLSWQLCPTLPVELQVAHGAASAYDEAHGLDADADVGGGEVLRHAVVAHFGLDAFGRHGVVRNEEQGTRWDVVEEAAGKECGRFHIYGHGSRFTEVVLKLFIVLPHAAVGRIDGACPIVVVLVAQGRRDGALQHKGRQCRHFGREIVVRCSFATYACQGKDVVAEMRLVRNAATLAQKETGRWFYGAQEVHNQRGVGAANAKVDHRDAIGRNGAEVGIETYRLGSRLLAKEVNVVVEIRQQDVLLEIAQRVARVSAQPVGHDLFSCTHGQERGFL